MYQLLLMNADGSALDVTQRVRRLSWGGSIRQVARQVEAWLAAPSDGSLPEVPCSPGAGLQLYVDGRLCFTGTVVTRTKSTEGSMLELTALDRGFYLVNNEGWFQFNGVTPEAAVKTICSGFGIPVGPLAVSGVPVSRKYPGVALSKIVDSLYTLAAAQNGRRYLARFSGAGALEVVEKPESAAAEIAPGKNLQSMRVVEDISGMCNSVAIYTQTGQLVRTVDDGESTLLYGTLQHILTQRDGEDAGLSAAAFLEDNGPGQTITVECLGEPSLVSGNAVVLRDNATGVKGLCWIDADTHTWESRQYSCRLTLNFRNLMNDTTAGSETK